MSQASAEWLSSGKLNAAELIFTLWEESLGSQMHGSAAAGSMYKGGSNALGGGGSWLVRRQLAQRIVSLPFSENGVPSGPYLPALVPNSIAISNLSSPQNEHLLSHGSLL